MQWTMPKQKTVSRFECINGLFFRIYFRSTSPSAALLTYLPCAISVRFSSCIRASENTEIFSRDEANNQLKSANFIFTRHLSSKEQWWPSNLLELFVGFSAVLLTIPWPSWVAKIDRLPDTCRQRSSSVPPCRPSRARSWRRGCWRGPAVARRSLPLLLQTRPPSRCRWCRCRGWPGPSAVHGCHARSCSSAHTRTHRTMRKKENTSQCLIYGPSTMCSNSAISENQELSPEFHFSTIADHTIGNGWFYLLTLLMSLQLILGVQLILGLQSLHS